MTRKTVPRGKLVVVTPGAGSLFCMLSAGTCAVAQITALSTPGRSTLGSWQSSSVVTMDRPASSWPVTTRRSRRVMGASLLLPDAELAEDPVEDLLDIHPARDPPQRSRRQAQILRPELRLARIPGPAQA